MILLAASMSQRNDAQSRLFVRTPNSLGKEVDRRLIEAAYGVWERARFVVIRYLAEDTDTAEILETAVDSASCSQNGHASIQQIEAYLLKCVARESIRRSRRNRRLTYIDPKDLERLAGAIAYDWDRDLDDERGWSFYGHRWMREAARFSSIGCLITTGLSSQM